MFQDLNLVVTPEETEVVGDESWSLFVEFIWSGAYVLNPFQPSSNLVEGHVVILPLTGDPLVLPLGFLVVAIIVVLLVHS